MTLGCQGAKLMSDDLQGLHADWERQPGLCMQVLQNGLRADSPFTGGHSVLPPAQRQAPSSLTVVGARQCSVQAAKQPSLVASLTLAVRV